MDNSTNYQAIIDRLKHELIVCKARLYDLTIKTCSEPTNPELKAEILGLRSEIKKLVVQRDDLKRRLA